MVHIFAIHLVLTSDRYANSQFTEVEKVRTMPNAVMYVQLVWTVRASIDRIEIVFKTHDKKLEI